MSLRRCVERQLIVLVMIISASLTGLTVWAVARQGDALREGELTGLRAEAERVAAERTGLVRRSTERIFLAARLAWPAGRESGIGRWMESLGAPWSVGVIREGEENWAPILMAATDRNAVAVAEALAAEDFKPAPAETEGIQLHSVVLEGPDIQVVAVDELAPGVWLGLFAPAAELIERRWERPDGNERWRAVLGDVGTDGRAVLVHLGDAFGGAVLVAGDEATARLKVQDRRRWWLVTATAVGSIGAWALVIWMMLRAVARQRELVKLQRRFVADVSHELKTPLTMIRLLAETLQDGRVRDPERVLAYHETITREAERLSVLLDGILDFSRIESGRKPTALVECDVADVARQAWQLFEPQFALEGFERELEIAPALPLVRADAIALQQVIVNLLQNAYRYAGDGKYVKLAVARDGYLIVITVEDRGIGMTRAQLERLGDSFYRAEDTRVRQTRGVGLGLAIVNHIVQAHGGKLEVHSRPHQGSTFTVWIPFEPGDEGRG